MNQLPPGILPNPVAAFTVKQNRICRSLGLAETEVVQREVI